MEVGKSATARKERETMTLGLLGKIERVKLNLQEEKIVSGMEKALALASEVIDRETV